MDTRQMRCIVAIAEAGSLTRAAEHLGLAQPALTQTLNRLEKELGARLFDRTRRGAMPTEAGLAILDDLRASLAHGDAATARARAIGAGRAGRLTIGFVTHALYEVLPHALRRLHAEHPQLDVVLREMSNSEQVAALEGGRIDIALLHPPVSVNTRVHELHLGHDPMLAALPADYPLAADGRVSLAEIAQHGLVWFPETQIPALRAQLLGALRRAGHETHVVQDANRTLTVLGPVNTMDGRRVASPNGQRRGAKHSRGEPRQGFATMRLVFWAATRREHGEKAATRRCRPRPGGSLAVVPRLDWRLFRHVRAPIHCVNRP